MSNTSTSQNHSTQKEKKITVGSYLKGFTFIFVCLVMLLALSGISYGRLNELLANILRWPVGAGAYLLALLIGIQGVLVLRGDSLRTYVSWGQLLALELLFLSLLAIWSLNSNEPLLLHASVLKSSGGLLGWTLAFFVSPFGATVGKAFLSLCILLLLPALFKWPLTRIQQMLVNQQKKVNDWQTSLQLPARADQAAFAATSGQQAARSYSSREKRSSENKSNRPTRPLANQPVTRRSTNEPPTRPLANQAAHQRVRAAGGSPVPTPSRYQSSAPLTRPLSKSKRVAAPAHEVIPPRQEVQRPLPTQKRAVRPEPVSSDDPSAALRPSFSRSSPPKQKKTTKVVTTTQAPPKQKKTTKAVTTTQAPPKQKKTTKAVTTTQAPPKQKKTARPKQPKTTKVVTTPARPKQQAKPTTSPAKKKPEVYQPQDNTPVMTDIDPPSPPERKINTVVPVSVVNKLKRNDLPPFDMLQQHSGKVDPLEAQEKARLIEETLEDFGVPVTVVEINQGPRITQFGVEPGFIETPQRDGSVKRRKVKVNAIKALSDDLALALAARSIRIQPRVPGRTYVGIELPNDEFETVTLHSVLTSEAYLKIKGDLVIALGRDVTGQPVAADISRMPHMLIAGATGSGKSVCINAIIASLLFNLGPDQLKLLLIDPKMVELVPYNGIPHLNTPVVTNMEKVVGSLSWAVREMERRYTLFSDARKRNLQSYNKWAKSNGHDTLPYVVIIIDELADLMMVAADEVEQIICRLAQMARATGIHLILATQRPSVDVVTGLIKANIPTRISFSVASGTDSRVILDSVGAEDLLGLGDMLYQASDASRLQRIQGCYVSDEELQDLVDYWLHAKAKKALSEIFRQKPPSKPIFQEQNRQQAAHQDITRKQENLDKLLPKAIALVEQNQSISISVLQRKLRISYTSAARLIKELKKQGVIGGPKK